MSHAPAPTLTLETHLILPFQLDWNGKPAATGNRADQLKQLGWTPVDHHNFDPIAAAPSTRPLDAAQLDRIRYQAYNYFHPYVRAFWFNDTIVKRFRHPKLHTLEVTLAAGEPITFRANCDLILFQPDIAVLVVHLACDTPLPLPTVENGLDQLRRIYPPYIAGDTQHSWGGHYPRHVRLLDAQQQAIAEYDEATQLNALRQQAETLMSRPTDERTRHLWAPHWRALLTGIATQPGDSAALQALQLGDDRAAVASLLSLHRPAAMPSVYWPAGQRLVDLIDPGHMARLCFADPAGSDPLPYSQPFLADFEARHCYDRFWYRSGESGDSPSRILHCGYAFAWLGDAGDHAYFANENDGAPAIYRHIYVPMAIIAHFQKAALLVTARKLADLTPYQADGRLAPPQPDDFDAIKRHFMAFTQTYWFDEITPQEQGIELFDLFRRHLRLQAHYDANRQAIQDIVEYIDTQQSEKLNRIAQVFAVFGIALAILSLVVGLLGINTFQLEDNHATPIHLPHWVLDFINEGLVANVHWLTGFTLLLALTGTYLIFKHCIRKPS